MSCKVSGICWSQKVKIPSALLPSSAPHRGDHSWCAKRKKISSIFGFWSSKCPDPSSSFPIFVSWNFHDLKIICKQHKIYCMLTFPHLSFLSHDLSLTDSVFYQPLTWTLQIQASNAHVSPLRTSVYPISRALASFIIIKVLSHSETGHQCHVACYTQLCHLWRFFLLASNSSFMLCAPGTGVLPTTFELGGILPIWGARGDCRAGAGAYFLPPNFVFQSCFCFVSLSVLPNSSSQGKTSWFQFAVFPELEEPAPLFSFWDTGHSSQGLQPLNFNDSSLFPLFLSSGMAGLAVGQWQLLSPVTFHSAFLVLQYLVNDLFFFKYITSST